jgi:hypothetical protein
MNDNKKEFSIARWIWGAGISLVLAGVIGWFNVRQFDLIDAIPYLVVLAFIASISIWLNKYCESQDVAFRTAAFAAKVALLFIMAINAAYSFSAMREMSVARKADAKREEIAKAAEREKTEREKERTKQAEARTKEVEAIASGAGRQAKYELSKRLGEPASQQAPEASKDAPVETEQIVFKKYESPLFWLMVIEACAAGLTFVLMSGLKALRDRPSLSKEEQAEREQWAEIAERRREYGDQLREKFARQKAQEMANPPATLPGPGPRRRIYTNGRDDSASHFSGSEKSHFDVSRESEFTTKPALAGDVSRDVSRDSKKRVSEEVKNTYIERLGYATSENGTTIPVNEKFRLVVRSDDGGSGFRVMVTWDVEGKEKGKGPQRYICRLSRDEWERAQGMTLAGFAREFLLPKHSARRPTDRVDQTQLDRITKFIRSMMIGGEHHV